jgi:hypothetical protein
MSNIFKKNSRFAALADEIKEIKKTNNAKHIEQNQTTNTNKGENIFKRTYDEPRPKRNYERRNIKEQNERKLREEHLENERIKEKEEIIRQSLSPESFPSLMSTPIEKQILPNMNYLNKLKNEGESNDRKHRKDEIDLEYENLKPGWAIAKKDPVTGKIVTKYKPSLTKSPRQKTQQEIGVDIINALVKLYEKQTEEYINMWGYDAWEKMYRFPNYDYDYFNKLDELYDEMENEESDDAVSDDDMYY